MVASPVSWWKYFRASTTAPSALRAPVTRRTGARFAQPFPASRDASTAGRAESSLATITNRHGCRFAQEGDHRAASIIRSIFSGSTCLSEKARRLRLADISREKSIGRSPPGGGTAGKKGLVGQPPGGGRGNGRPGRRGRPLGLRLALLRLFPGRALLVRSLFLCRGASFFLRPAFRVRGGGGLRIPEIGGHRLLPDVAPFDLPVVAVHHEGSDRDFRVLHGSDAGEPS